MISPPPPNITKYKTVASETSDDFDNEINDLLSKGWTLRGRPLHYVNDKSLRVKMVYVQNMVKID